MRIKVSVILLGFFITSALMGRTSSQPLRFSHHFKKTPLRQALQTISQQTHTRFVFNDSLVLGKMVHCRIDKLTAEEALTAVLNATDIVYQSLSKNLIVLYTDSMPFLGLPEPKTNSGELFKPTNFTPPVLLTDINAFYPVHAQEFGIEGTVVVHLLVEENGQVLYTKIKKSSGYVILDDAATYFGKKLKYRPATKNGIPFGVWISKTFNFKLSESSFLPLEYVQQIKDLQIQAENANPQEKNQILREILLTHQALAERLGSNTLLQYDEYIREVVHPQVYQMWRDFLVLWPLRFVVFHDFIHKYPHTPEVTNAKANMIFFMEEDLNRISQLPENRIVDGQNKKQLYRRMQSFLYAYFPSTIPRNLNNKIIACLQKE